MEFGIPGTKGEEGLNRLGGKSTYFSSCSLPFGLDGQVLKRLSLV